MDSQSNVREFVVKLKVERLSNGDVDCLVSFPNGLPDGARFFVDRDSLVKPRVESRVQAPPADKPVVSLEQVVSSASLPRSTSSNKSGPVVACNSCIFVS